MISLDIIRKAHATYTGPDFPKLIHAFKEMDLKSFEYNIERGIITYYSMTGDCIEDIGVHVDIEIPLKSKSEYAIHALRDNQKGTTTFPDFCKAVAYAGVYKWIVDLEAMTCTYYDKLDHCVILEEVPSM